MLQADNKFASSHAKRGNAESPEQLIHVSRALERFADIHSSRSSISDKPAETLFTRVKERDKRERERERERKERRHMHPRVRTLEIRSARAAASSNLRHSARSARSFALQLAPI